MEQTTGTVTYLFNKNYVEVAPWDGGDGPGGERAVAEVSGKIRRGDVVELRPAAPRQDPWARLVYVLPVLSFILGFLMGSAAGLDLVNRLVAGAVLGVMALVLAWITNRRTRLRRVMRYEVARVVRRTGEDNNSSPAG